MVTKYKVTVSGATCEDNAISCSMEHESVGAALSQCLHGMVTHRAFLIQFLANATMNEKFDRDERTFLQGMLVVYVNKFGCPLNAKHDFDLLADTERDEK